MFRLALHWQILIGVVLAAAIGLTLNFTAGTRESEKKIGENTLEVYDSVDLIKIRLVDAKGNVVKGKEYVIDPTGQTEGAFLSLAQLKKAHPVEYIQFVQYGRSTARWVGDMGYMVGQLFLRMLKMVSVPLIITSLLSGVLGLASAGRLRKLFTMTLSYYIATSVLAIVTGIFLVNAINPGGSTKERMEAKVQGKEELPPPPDLGDTLYQQVERLIPENPLYAVVESEFLSIIAFSIAFGVFTILIGGHTLQLFRDFFGAAFEVMMKMTMAIIFLAPYGVFGLMLYATATQGGAVFQTLAWYLATVALALAVHAMITLPLILQFVAKRNPFEYIKALSPALLTAFSSASSNATLPLTMNCVEKRANIDNRVGSFVLPLGATVNMDGTALFEVIAVLFIAQLTPGVNLTLAEQFLIAFTALLASIGAAGIPSAGLVMMIIVLQAVNLPTDRVGLILAVDRILDMCRTSVNVWSDACGCAVVARFDTGTEEPPAEMKQAVAATT